MISASAIAVVAGHSCAIQAGTGAVWCWGHNRAGEATPPPSVDGSMGTATAIAAAS
jgi:alpha-tubulin suppressor-like RCC1 family protein